MDGFTHNLGLQETCLVALGGAIGALVKDVVNDGAIELPYKKERKIFLGCLGGTLIGAFVGLALDGNFISALLAGYTGTSLIANLTSSVSIRSRSLNKPDSQEATKEKEAVKT
jgi:hypothetical protein